MYRTRYAPSPTGEMHLGHARTSLVTWLRARQQGGEIVMRIEDLDPPRVKAGSEASILRDHEWLGLDYDEGPIRQSERFELYEHALEVLKPHLFRCSCTRREIQAASAPHEGEHGPRYPGTCHDGPTHPERKTSIRFRMHGHSPGFEDLLAGSIAEDQHADDFIVRRSDGLYAYQLAVVVDDADARISEVIRGDDLLSSTPKQIALYRALGAQVPAFLHVPLVRGADGERLSKRHGATGIAAYREAGWTAQEVLALLAGSLGIPVTDSPRPAIELSELLELFSLGALRRFQNTPNLSNVIAPLG